MSLACYTNRDFASIEIIKRKDEKVFYSMVLNYNNISCYSRYEKQNGEKLSC